MVYLTEDWRQPNLRKAAAIVNFEEAISAVIAIIIYILTETCIGRFKMVLFTTASFILGLLLLGLSTWLLVDMKTPIFYVALLMISFGKAGKDPPFKNFVGDQLSGTDAEQVHDRTTFWWRVCRFSGAAISVFFMPDSWDAIFLICAAVMTATYLIFIAGTCRPYNYTLPLGNPFSIPYKVLKAALAKHSLNYPRTPASYFLNQRNELPLFPRDPFLRCIDKAAIVEQASFGLRVEAESHEKNLCTVEEVRKTKSLLRLFPLWFVFIIYGLVTAAGNTFFIEQSNNLDTQIGNGIEFPINAFFIIKSLLSSIVSYVADLLLGRFCSINYMWKLKGALIRVGVGIGISVICCGVASLVEHARLDLVRIHGNPHIIIIEEATLPMTILWLIPQYILLGLMDGFSEDGLSELFYIFAHESMHGIETPINELMLGIGKVLSVGCVFVFRGWFGETINASRLDKYFNMLMYLSLGNLVFYILIGYYYVYIHKQEATFESNRPQRETAQQQEAAQPQEPEPEPEPALEQEQEQEQAQDAD